jgi:hypothetical protein
MTNDETMIQQFYSDEYKANTKAATATVTASTEEEDEQKQVHDTVRRIYLSKYNYNNFIFRFLDLFKSTFIIKGT